MAQTMMSSWRNSNFGGVTKAPLDQRIDSDEVHSCSVLRYSSGRRDFSRGFPLVGLACRLNQTHASLVEVSRQRVKLSNYSQFIHTITYCLCNAYCIFLVSSVLNFSNLRGKRGFWRRYSLSIAISPVVASYVFGLSLLLLSNLQTGLQFGVTAVFLSGALWLARESIGADIWRLRREFRSLSPKERVVVAMAFIFVAVGMIQVTQPEIVEHTALAWAALGREIFQSGHIIPSYPVLRDAGFAQGVDVTSFYLPGSGLLFGLIFAAKGYAGAIGGATTPGLQFLIGGILFSVGWYSRTRREALAICIAAVLFAVLIHISVEIRLSDLVVGMMIFVLATYVAYWASNPASAQAGWAGCLTGLIAFVHPAGFVLLPAVVATRLLAGENSRARLFKEISIFLVTAIAIPAPFLLWNVLNYVPGSFGAPQVVSSLSDASGKFIPSIVLLILGLLLATGLSITYPRTKVQRSRERLISAFPILLMTTFILMFSALADTAPIFKALGDLQWSLGAGILLAGSAWLYWVHDSRLSTFFVPGMMAGIARGRTDFFYGRDASPIRIRGGSWRTLSSVVVILCVSGWISHMAYAQAKRNVDAQISQFQIDWIGFFEAELTKVIKANWPNYSQITKLDASADENARFLVFRPSDYSFYGKHSFYGYEDPSLLSVFSARDETEIRQELLRKNINYVLTPSYRIPEIYNSSIEPLLADPHHALLVGDLMGYRAFRLLDDRNVNVRQVAGENFKADTGKLKNWRVFNPSSPAKIDNIIRDEDDGSLKISSDNDGFLSKANVVNVLRGDIGSYRSTVGQVGPKEVAKSVLDAGGIYVFRAMVEGKGMISASLLNSDPSNPSVVLDATPLWSGILHGERRTIQSQFLYLPSRYLRKVLLAEQGEATLTFQLEGKSRLKVYSWEISKIEDSPPTDLESRLLQVRAFYKANWSIKDEQRRPWLSEVGMLPDRTDQVFFRALGLRETSLVSPWYRIAGAALPKRETAQMPNLSTQFTMAGQGAISAEAEVECDGGLGDRRPLFAGDSMLTQSAIPIQVSLKLHCQPDAIRIRWTSRSSANLSGLTPRWWAEIGKLKLTIDGFDTAPQKTLN